MPHILYLAHDLDDAAIWRRVAMLRLGGASVEIAGFRRGGAPLPEPARVLGRTANARMGRRIASVAKAWIARAAAGGACDAIIARNLEMLALAVPAARRRGRDGAAPRVVYEVLDVHRLMLRGDLVGRALRAMERRLCRSVDLLLVSSPAFLSRHFERYYPSPPPALLVENKVMAETEAPAPGMRPAGGPVTIGWFGILRCPFSLSCLDRVTRATPGRYRVILRGRPAYDSLPDFDAVVKANDDLAFGGAYRYPDDLSEIYGAVDLAWLVDRYDAGENSDWLLPNRLYESGRSRVPPICLAGTEVARKAAALGIGVELEAPSVAAAREALDGMDPARLARLRGAMGSVPGAAFSTDAAECRALVEAIVGAGARRGAA
ncbi:MAG: glycosyl transferase [Jannaschia sp.]